MSKVDRNKPRRSTASESRYTLFEFDQDFPDDAACLDYLTSRLYPNGIYCKKCERVTKHHRVASRPSYSCQFCGRHEHPMKGTIFEGSATSLRLWFYGIYLMASTRCGISAKQLERETGVTYKTAWRMFKQIRTLFNQDGEPFTGTVEADESYFGGVARWQHASKRNAGKRHRRDVGPRGGRDKTAVLGMAQRGSYGSKGKVAAVVVDSASSADLLPQVGKRVLSNSTVYTDEWRSYKGLTGMGYHHQRIPHAQQVYVSGDVHTQTIEGFWSLAKRGISGVYHGVSTKHLQSYLDEYVFRYNNRDATGRGMFDAVISRVRKASVPTS